MYRGRRIGTLGFARHEVEKQAQVGSSKTSIMDEDVIVGIKLLKIGKYPRMGA